MGQKLCGYTLIIIKKLVVDRDISFSEEKLHLPKGGGGGGPGVGLSGVPLKDCFLLSERCWQWQKNFDWPLGALNNLMASSLCSRSVARCIKRSAVSHIISLIGSLGSILSRCCRIRRNGTSWGVSATYENKYLVKLSSNLTEEFLSILKIIIKIN